LAACADERNTDREKKTRTTFRVSFGLTYQADAEGHKMSSSALVGMALRVESATWKRLAAARGQQVVALLLTSIPLAERMLLYHVAMTAWVMLPERGLFEKTLISCFGRLGLSRSPAAS
jgi:hypothetical protein